MMYNHKLQSVNEKLKFNMQINLMEVAEEVERLSSDCDQV